MPLIQKGDGTTERFDPQKLEDSLIRSGAPFQLSRDITTAIENEITEGMSTTEIYRRAFTLLKQAERPMAARYSMRRAILELGPTGFRFEDYVTELLRAQGFKARPRVLLKGKCVEHEVDVLAESPEKCIAAELKFHNEPGYKTDVKVALYVSARFRDIVAGSESKGGKCPIDEMWLITNTKFTNQAIQYGTCAGLTLLSWDYPAKGNLASMIEKTGLYPVTALTSLTKAEKDRLMMQNTALCRNVVENEAALNAAGIAQKKHKAVLEESKALCGA